MPDTSAVLLAAGRSERMGKHKALLDWDGTLLINYQIEALLSAGIDDLVVVLGKEAERVSSAIGQESRADLKVVINEDYDSGRVSSIKTGLAVVDRDSSTILFSAVDQPRDESIITALLDSHKAQSKPISIPTCRGRGGHPIVFSSELRECLTELSEERGGFRELTRAMGDKINYVPFDDPMVLLEFNTPEEYEQACKLYCKVSRL